MDHRKELLLKSAARLYSLGIEVDAAKERLRTLVNEGVGYDDPKMLQALDTYTEMKKQWESLERDYIDLRNEVESKTKRMSEEQS